jgi:3-oxoisoapionate decarboxylase
MKIGISSFTYSWSIGIPGYPPACPMTVMELLERAALFGAGVIQIADNMPLDTLSEAELSSLNQRARALGISVEVGTRGIAPDHLKRYLDLAHQFGSPILRVVVDTAKHHPSPQEIVETLLPMQDLFETAGVTLAIENHDRFTARTFADMVERLGSWVGICLDTVNSFGALEGPQVVVETLAPLTVNLHVKDFTIFRAGHSLGFTIEGRPAGQGKLDLPWLIGEMQRYGRNPNAILELWTPPETSLEATIAKEHRWAKESFAYLQTVIPARK